MTSLLEILASKTGYMTLQEVAALLGLHTMTLRKWVKVRKIAAVRIGDKICFDPATIAAWLEARSM